MIRRLLLTYLTITAITLAVLAVPLGITFTDRERDRFLTGLERDAATTAALVEEALEHEDDADAQAQMRGYALASRARVEVFNAAGKPTADNGQGTARADTADIRAALAGGPTRGTVDTDAGRYAFATVPVGAGSVLGAVRVSVPESRVQSDAREIWAVLASLSLLVLGLVAGVGFLLARGVTRPIRDLEATADRLARGDLRARVVKPAGVPEVRSLAGTFNATADRLADLVGAQQRFLADAAHELRTPLTALRLRLENFEDKLPPEELGKLDAAAEEVARLSRLVDGLLALARNEGQTPVVQTVEAGPIAVERVEGWAPVAEEDGVLLRHEVAPGTSILAPPGTVEQILDNLLANAVAACAGGGEVVVSVAAGRPGTVLLRVTDDGCGLSAEQRERAFDRFWRADRTAPGGTGLGLAVVRQLARSAGGDAVLEPNPAGRGTSAVVWLPAVPVNRDQPN